MSWPPDVPDLPMEKPKELEILEELDDHVLNAMTDVEVEERIRDAAVALATAFHNEIGGDYETCVIVVSGALKETGGAIGGPFGEAMIGLSHTETEYACRLVFEPSGELDI